jgi:cytoskeleton protein RodZ
MTAQNNTESSSDQSPDLEGQSLPSVGELLGKERLRQGLTEKEVADELHITMHYVRAIESNSFDKLPGNVFAKGYVKSYVLLLGMDMPPVMASYDAHVASELDVAKEKTRLQVRRRKDKNRPWVIASGVLFVALFIGLWFLNYSSTEPEPAAGAELLDNLQTVSEAPSNSANLRPAAVSQAAPDDASPSAGEELDLIAEPSAFPGPVLAVDLVGTAAETTTGIVQEGLAEELVGLDTTLEVESAALALTESEDAPPVSSGGQANAIGPVDVTYSGQVIYVEAAGNDVLLISFSGESWVEISDNSQGQIYRDLLKIGDVLEVKGTTPFNVLLGDAPFAELSLNGDTIDVSDDIRIDNSARLTVGLKQ